MPLANKVNRQNVSNAAGEPQPSETRMPRRRNAEMFSLNFTTDSLPNPPESVKHGIRVLKLRGVDKNCQVAFRR